VQIIDAAMDSSRYFALRIENPETGSHVFIGIGFAERETAGQFKLTLAEHGRCAPQSLLAVTIRRALQPTCIPREGFV
jgi:hypothetical protein